MDWDQAVAVLAGVTATRTYLWVRGYHRQPPDGVLRLEGDAMDAHGVTPDGTAYHRDGCPHTDH